MKTLEYTKNQAEFDGDKIARRDEKDYGRPYTSYMSHAPSDHVAIWDEAYLAHFGLRRDENGSIAVLPIPTLPGAKPITIPQTFGAEASESTDHSIFTDAKIEPLPKKKYLLQRKDHPNGDIPVAVEYRAGEKWLRSFKDRGEVSLRLLGGATLTEIDSDTKIPSARPFKHDKDLTSKEEALLKSPRTHPDHTIVGHHFGGYHEGATVIYFCDSYDPHQGFWLTNIGDPTDRRNVSEAAIDRTFPSTEDRGDHYWVHRWYVRVPKK